MTKLLLGVNIDHIATLRQARGTSYPDPVHAALIAETAGADSITLHLREDRRHIQDRDVILLKDLLQTRMNLEMAATAEMVDFACTVQPHACCLVPEKRAELTTEGGLDVITQQEALTTICQRLQQASINVSLFIDPVYEQIDAAIACGVNMVEIQTGSYADSPFEQQIMAYRKLADAVQYAASQGLIVNAGHGLHYHNVQRVAALPLINELNIGHAIISRAAFDGLAKAVHDMKQLMIEARLC